MCSKFEMKLRLKLHEHLHNIDLLIREVKKREIVIVEERYEIDCETASFRTNLRFESIDAA